MYKKNIFFKKYENMNDTNNNANIIYNFNLQIIITMLLPKC